MSYTVPRTNPVSLRRGERMRFAAKRRPVRQNPTPGVDLTSVLVGAMIGAAAIYLTRSSRYPCKPYLSHSSPFDTPVIFFIALISGPHLSPRPLLALS